MPGTDSASREFRKAVLRLTGVYAFGATIVLVVFSAVVYALFIRTIVPDQGELLERYGYIDPREESLLAPHELAEQLPFTLLVADLVVLVLTTALGYVLARTTLDPIRRSYVRQRRFVADAAHELRTPLAVLAAGADLMRTKTRTPHEYQEYVETVHSEIRRLTTLTNNLLSLARNEAGDVKTPMLVDLSQLVQATCASMRWYAKEQSCVMTERITAGLLITGVHDDIVQVLMNLLKNAIDYSKPHGHVTVTLVPHHSHVQLSVQDDGVGIPEEKQHDIFDRFVSGVHEPSHGHSAAGAGLGLAIVRELTEAHRGTVTLTSNPGQGTTVIVQLPRSHSSTIHESGVV